MNVVVLAAGLGKRMNSDLPKVLHPLAGRPLLAHVIAAARQLNCARINIVVGHGGERVRSTFPAPDLRWATQQPQLGTGHAVMQALSHLDDAFPTLVLYGDVPLTRVQTLLRLINVAREGSSAATGITSMHAGNNGGNSAALAVLTVMLDDPTGYGRIVRHAAGNGIARIVEQKDASATERAIREVNTGIMVAPTVALKRWLARLSNDNAQREYYLTDIVAMAAADGVPVVAAQPDAAWETLGVNSKSQLAALERQYQFNEAERLLAAGVTLADPARIDVRGRLTCGRDVTIDVGCVFEGEVTLGDGVCVGPYALVRNASVAAGARIAAFCHIDGDALGVTIGKNAIVGPYARLRPGADLGAEVHIGNFVEVKNSTLASGAKANHLAYLGDATIGARVNVGAGTITCNYDGANKHRTVIEDDVQIGSDVQLVAPVTVGKGATIGAGTTVWKDVPPGTLAVNEKTQVAKSGWTRPEKKTKG